MTVQADQVRVLDAHLQQDEASFDRQLRPVSLDEFVGQESLKERLTIFIEAARQREENLSHVLFHGRPDWAKQPWRIFSRTKCNRRFGSLRDQYWTSRGIWLRF